MLQQFSMYQPFFTSRGGAGGGTLESLRTFHRRHAGASTVAAQSMGSSEAGRYPDRPIRVLVPYAPGGSSDAVARILNPKLTESLGQKFVIDNHSGSE
jgi:tripartite-type tricarboxylate transporter receptor subunit TctC